MANLIDRQKAIDAMLNDKVEITPVIKVIGNEYGFEVLNETCDRHAKMLRELPSVEPQITHQYCAKVLKKLWDDEVILFCEYDRIMDRLKKRMEADND